MEKRIFNRKLKQIMQDRDLTQADVGRLCGITAERMSYYAHKGSPNRKNLVKLSKGLGVDIGWWTEGPPPELCKGLRDGRVSLGIQQADLKDGTFAVKIEGNLPRDVINAVMETLTNPKHWKSHFDT